VKILVSLAALGGSALMLASAWMNAGFSYL
jgi:hypothetical protein